MSPLVPPDKKIYIQKETGGKGGEAGDLPCTKIFKLKKEVSQPRLE
jgi:hypothetical protein